MKIKITYITGNSFGSHIDTDFIEGEWDDINIIKDNVNAIIEHNNYIEKYNNDLTTTNERLSILNHIKNRFWFVEGTMFGEDNWKHSIKLKIDKNKTMKINCFWIGYFESLVDVDISIK